MPLQRVSGMPATTQTKTVAANEQNVTTTALAIPLSGANGKNKQVNDGASRFCMLSRIDANQAKYKEKTFRKDITLKRFCDDFRNYASNKLNLY